ncbi:MAG: 4Fe4S-binding leucine-rich repeat protein, partial [Candidatus Thiodiazotropha sp.]
MTIPGMLQGEDATPTADCTTCPHQQDRLQKGRCHPGDVCVRAVSGRQIARFFKINPDLAEFYAGDEFWERRAIAARYLSQQKLLQMLDDPDEVVRRVLAYRLPVDELDPLVHDPDREVRITVADRLPAEELEQLVKDED